MSLATRCPRCQTVFRVVPDQLRVSEGWVRCGRCSEVFNAARSLIDPGTGEARRAPIELHSGLPASAGAAAGAVADPAAGPAAESVARPLADHATETAADMAMAGLATAEAPPEAGPTRSGAEAWPAAGVATARGAGEGIRAEPRTDATVGTAPDTPHDTPQETTHFTARHTPQDTPRTPRDGTPGDATLDRAVGTAPEPAVGTTSDGTGTDAGVRAAEAGFDVAGERRADAAAAGMPAAAALPSFLRHAERAQRWRRPAVRTALAAGVLVATLALGAQWLFAWRDYAAARWPALQPRLALACAWLGCQLQPWRTIDALVVDSSGLVRVEKTDQYRLSLTLRNQRDLEVALPAFDLALTDTQGRLIARRVLRSGELGATGATLAPGGEVALQATLRVAAAPVAGYTIEIFHP
jgi:predicted Zn finger-like uncharacterized protein